MADALTYYDTGGIPVPISPREVWWQGTDNLTFSSSRGYTREGGGSFSWHRAASFGTRSYKDVSGTSFLSSRDGGYSSKYTASESASGSTSYTASYTERVGEPGNTQAKTLTTTEIKKDSGSAKDSSSMTRNKNGFTNSSTVLTFEYAVYSRTPKKTTGEQEYEVSSTAKDTTTETYLKITESFLRTNSTSYYTSLKPPYDYSVLSRTARYISTQTEATSSSYSSTFTHPSDSYILSTYAQSFISQETASSTAEGPNGTYINDIIITVADTGAWGGQLWVLKGARATGVFSECFKKINANIYTYRRTVKSIYKDVLTRAVDPQIKKSSKTISAIPKINGANSTRGAIICATYKDFPHYRSVETTLELGLGVSHSYTLFYEDLTTSELWNGHSVFKYNASRLVTSEPATTFYFTRNSGSTTTNGEVSFGPLFVTKNYQVLGRYYSTFSLTSPATYVEVESYTSSKTDSSSGTTSGNPGNSSRAGGTASTMVEEGFTGKGLYTTVQKPIVLNDIVDLREQFRYTCQAMPSGFLGFAGTFDYKKISSQKVYRSIKSASKGIPFKGAVDFHLFDLNPSLFASARQNGVVIVPSTSQTFPYFTVEAVPPTKLQTSAEITVFYSTTSITTVKTDSSFVSQHSFYGITKSRGSGLSFTTGTTLSVATYSVYTSTNTRSTITKETAITYRYSLSKELNNTKYFTQGIADTSYFQGAFGRPVTYGMVGGTFKDTVISIGGCLLKYTLEDSRGNSLSGKKSMTNISKENFLTLKEGSFMYFEAHPLYSTFDHPIYGPEWSVFAKYYFP